MAAEYTGMNWLDRIAAGPALLLDGRNILDLAALRKIGFRAEGIGKG